MGKYPDRLPLWAECIGTIAEIKGGTLVVNCCRHIRLTLQDEQLRKYSRLLRKGSRIGILQLDDGSVRIRLVANKFPTGVLRHRMGTPRKS